MANYGPNAWYLSGNAGIIPVDLLTANNAAGATLTLTSVTVPAGANIVVAVSEFGTTTPGSMADGTNTYTLLTSEQMNGGVGIVMLFYSLNVSALNAATITYTKGVSGDKVSMAGMYAISSVALSVDTAVTAVAQGTGTAVSVTSGTPAVNGDWVVGVVGWNGAGGYTFTNTATAFATPFDTVNTQNNASLGGGNLNVLGNLPIAFTGTIGTSSPWGAIVAGFKPASGPTGWWNVAQWTASATPAAGTLNRQSATPVQGNERVFAVTVAGTNGGSEPAWTITKGAKTTSNTTTYIEVTGQPAVNGDDAVAMTAATSASSAAGSVTLTFTSVPAGMSTGLLALDKTTAGVIPGRTTVAAFTSTTVTLSNAITGSGVGSGDTIAFSNTPAWQDINLGVATTVALGYIIQDKTGAHLFVVTTAGSIGTTEPTWNTTTGSTTTDSTTTWTCLGATGAYSAWAAPHARINNAGAWIAVNGATIYTSDNHSEQWNNGSFSIGWNFNTYIVCVDHTASVPPGPSNLKTTAAISQNANVGMFITHGAAIVYDGINFYTTPGTNGQSINIGGNATSQLITIKNGSIVKQGTTVGSITVANGSIIFNNTSVKFGNVGDHLQNSGGSFTWLNTPSAISGSVLPTTLFTFQTSTEQINYTDGVDLSALGSGNIVNLSTSPSTVYLKNCKLGSGFVLNVASNCGGNVQAVNCDSGATQYMQLISNYFGTLVPSTSVIMTGGASDGVEGISWNLTTTANSTWLSPLTSFSAQAFYPNTQIWNVSVGTSVGVYIRGIVNAATVPRSDQIWMEVEYLGSSGSPQASFSNTTKSNNFASGTSYTADTTAWDSQVAARQNTHAYVVGNTITVGGGQVWFCTTSGTSAGSQPGGYSAAPDGTSVTDGTAVFRAGCRFVMNVSVTPQLAGYIYVRIKAALPTTSYWINPLIQSS